ncbi:MAG: hypothetical protein ACM362_12380, partial [Candidatus Methylomirabilota bacterium]
LNTQNVSHRLARREAQVVDRRRKKRNMNSFHAVVIGLLLLLPWSLVGVNLVGAAVTTVGRKLALIRKKS